MMKSKHNGNGHGHITETPDVSHIRNVDVTHEISDVDIRGIVSFIIGLSVMTIFVYLLVWGMFKVLYSKEERRDLSDDPPSPMAMSSQERLPPEPRLQSAPGFAEELEKAAGAKKEEDSKDHEVKPKDPLWEIRLLREQWKATLAEGVKDPSGKIVVLPIEEAKKELLRQGLPVRSQ
jgi:hypothetical protein